MHTLPKSRTPFEDIPTFRFSGNDPPPRDKERLRIGDMNERKPANHRTRPGSDPCSRRSREISVCNRAADRNGRIGLLPSLPPSSRAASKRDANRITERIVA